jgi:prolyl oligopeptidase
MIKKKIFFLVLLFGVITKIFSQSNLLPEKTVFTECYGKTISDSYSYLEQGSDTLSKTWFKQNSVNTREILDNISGRKEIVDKLLEIEKRRTFSASSLKIATDNQYFYLKKTDQDKTAKLYYKNSEKGQEILLFDPKEYKSGSNNTYSISYYKPSWDTKKVAISFSKNGEEISEIAFLNTETKTLLPEIITNCWPAELGGINWLTDNSGIIYLNIPIVDNKNANYILNTESVIYKLGDDPSNHKVIFSKKSNPEINIDPADFPEICEFNINDKYILGKLNGASSNLDYYYATIGEFENKKIQWKQLFKKEQGFTSPIIVNEDVYCLSSKNSPNYKIIKTKIANPDFDHAETIVDENKNETIDSYEIIKEGIVYSITKNGIEAKLYFVDSNKIIKPITLPIKAGTVIIRTKNKYSSDIWVHAGGWLNPLKRYRYDLLKNSYKEDQITPVTSYPEFDNFIVEEIEFPSHDGVMLPVSIIYKKALKKNKMNNVLIEGYGAYGESMSSGFDPISLSWVLNDGILVVSHVRGGGEKGEEWYKSGYKQTKPNTWKDLIATAEYLIKEKITNNKKIAIHSGSAGGILVGRAITERPDLFKVMLCDNGFLNPLRIDVAPNGPNNMKEFGDPKIKEEFNALYEMDAYHHIKKGIKYPACLITTGMNDARVAPWMSGKFVAKLRASTISNNPILFAVDYNTGHGLDSSNLQLYNDFADLFAFAFWQMGHPKFKLVKK